MSGSKIVNPRPARLANSVNPVNLLEPGELELNPHPIRTLQQQVPPDNGGHCAMTRLVDSPRYQAECRPA